MSLLVLLIIILLQPIASTGILAQFSATPQGILVNAGGQQVEMAVAGAAAFRISISYSGTPAVIPSIFIDNSDTTHAAYTIISDAPSYGIQTSYGKLMINTDTKKWSLYDAGGNVIIPSGSYTVSGTSQSFNDGPKNSGIFYGSGNQSTKDLIKTSSSTGMSNGTAGIPYFWNSSGYGALGITINDNIPAQWNSSGSSTANWIFPGTSADLYVWPAKTLYDAMNGLVQLTGKPKVPPKWAFGYLQSRWGWGSRDYIESTIDSFRNRKLPVDAFIYDFEWYTVTPDYSIGSGGTADFSDFGFNQSLFPEPAEQIYDYQGKGVKFIGIRKPRLGNTANLDLARSKGWLMNAGIGNRDINFSIDSLRLWYATQTEPLLDAGIDAWWDDEGESYYTCYYWWNKTQSDLRDSVRPNDRHFTINRAFSPGSQRMGYCTWNGDIPSTWDALYSTPADLLNWSLSGMYYGTCDIGGFQGNPSIENLVRWFQAAVFFPVMRAHSVINATPRFPWLWGHEGEAAIREALNLRYRLIPFIYSLGHEAYNTGAPIMRPLIMEFQDDALVTNLRDEWLLGKGLLVAPVMSQGGTRSVYLPNDLWYDFQTNQTIQGPTTFSVSKTLDQIPVYVRAGTILPVGPVIQNTGEVTAAPLEIHIYPGHDATFILTEDDGISYNYIKDSVRTTTYTWTDATNTLSWQVYGSYSDKYVYTAIVGVFGDQEDTISLGTQGSIVFNNYHVNSFIPVSFDASEASINLYPNPAGSKFTVELAELKQGSWLSVLNVNGQELIKRQITNNKTQIDISNLVAGIYFVRLKNEKMVKVMKIIKK